MRKIAEEFSGIVLNSKDEFFGCVMAIDGWVCATRKLYDSETDFPRKYRNRKGLWGITVLAGCDARGKFMLFSCNGSGSANDVLAWRWSHMENHRSIKTIYGGITASLLPRLYFSIGDEAFVCENQLLVPYSGRGNSYINLCIHIFMYISNYIYIHMYTYL
jgi:hypothetical protein